MSADENCFPITSIKLYNFAGQNFQTKNRRKILQRFNDDDDDDDDDGSDETDDEKIDRKRKKFIIMSLGHPYEDD